MGSPEFFQTTAYGAPFAPEKRISDAKNVDHFTIDDLLDLPNDDIMVDDDSALPDANNGNSVSSSVATPEYSSFPTVDSHFQAGSVDRARPFADELCVPTDDLAELEWLSNFEEESFSSEDLQKLQLIQGIHARNGAGLELTQYQCQTHPTGPGPVFRSQVSVPAKARSKRSRAGPGNWTSRLLMVSPNSTPNAGTTISSSPEPDITVGQKAPKVVQQKKKEGGSDSSGGGGSGSEGRRCLHCATDKTPQWRTGPLGPKTLCNACGVRYKSGRLVPEYRPAASPTFVLTKHSNSHRKVLELRRQKEMMRAQHHQQQFIQHHHQNMMFDVANAGDEYLIHQHVGTDFRQLI